jgi:antitoxin ParD1/3/4
MTVKSSISLTDEQDAFVRSLVTAGRFSSASAVLQQGVDLLRRQLQAEEADTEALRAILRERLDGPFVPSGTMRDRVEALIATKRRDAEG